MEFLLKIIKFFCFGGVNENQEFREKKIKWKKLKIIIPKFYHLYLEIEEPKVLGEKFNEVARMVHQEGDLKINYRKRLMWCIDLRDQKDLRDRGLNALKKIEVYKATRNSQHFLCMISKKSLGIN